MVTAYLEALGAGSPSSVIAGFFAEDVGYDVPGDRKVAWWVGRREGRAGVERFRWRASY